MRHTNSSCGTRSDWANSLLELRFERHTNCKTSKTTRVCRARNGTKTSGPTYSGV